MILVLTSDLFVHSESPTRTKSRHKTPPHPHARIGLLHLHLHKEHDLLPCAPRGRRLGPAPIHVDAAAGAVHLDGAKVVRISGAEPSDATPHVDVLVRRADEGRTRDAHARVQVLCGDGVVEDGGTARRELADLVSGGEGRWGGVIYTLCASQPG